MQPLAPPTPPAGATDTAHATPACVAVARLGEEARRAAGRIVARARAARLTGATVEAYRASALELDHQATRAERLLFSQAVETFRAVAAENRLIADALEFIEGGR